MLYEVITVTITLDQNNYPELEEINLFDTDANTFNNFVTNGSIQFVITSYSIHYTKLYENRLDAGRGRENTLFHDQHIGSVLAEHHPGRRSGRVSHMHVAHVNQRPSLPAMRNNFV